MSDGLSHMKSQSRRRVVIMTSGQPSANPRMVKEATALASAGYNVTVLYLPLSSWADEFDKELFRSTPEIRWILCGFHPSKNKALYRYARTRRKMFAFGFKLSRKYFFAVRSYTLFQQELQVAALSCPADLYIAHNLGALPGAVKAARKHNARIIFDAEDFHRGEVPAGSLSAEAARLIEDKNLTQIAHLTAASPLIAKQYELLYPNLRVLAINNVFSLKFLSRIQREQQETLRLFWFSQTVGWQRGLEDVIEAMGALAVDQVRLTVLGRCTFEMKKSLFELATKKGVAKDQLNFLPPQSPQKIFEIAANHDVGLALETGFSENNRICLSNKLFTYMLSGLAVIVSDTPAQNAFISDYPSIGFLNRSGDKNGLAALLDKFIRDPSLLERCKVNSLRLAVETFNWEMESKKYLSFINSILY